VKPLRGRITAIDLNKNTVVWQVAHGETLNTVTNHPMLKGVTVPRTGRRRGAILRAYDEATRQDVADLFIPALRMGRQ
jgi:hypothetical protein